MPHAKFTLRIGPRTADGYAVQATSRKGSASGLLKLPFSLDHPGETFAFDGEVSREWHVTSGDGLTESEIKRRGHELFQALFCGPIGELWHLSLGAVPGEASRLNLCIELDPELDGIAPLLSVPWEIMFDGRDFLSRRRRTPVLRLVEGLADEPPLLLPSPLRVLCIVADPNDQVRLDLGSERRGIEQAAQSRRGVEVIVGRPASLAELAEMIRCRGDEIHVLHFAGHGHFDEKTGKGALVLRGKDGRSCAVLGEDLAEQLKDVQSLRLAVLNACKTARTSWTEAGHSFAGVATALLRAIPAVVAMQSAIDDSQAVAFSADLYRRLLGGEPIELAVTEARLAMLSHQPNRLDWAIPALYSRLSGEHLFTPPSSISWTDVRRALRSYLGRMVADHRTLKTPAPPWAREIPSVDAEALFVEPWCRRTHSLAIAEPDAAPWEGPLPKTFDAAPVRIEEILRTERAIVLLGEAGSGKTTLLARLAAQMASARLKHEDESEDETVPPVPVLVPASTILQTRREQLCSPGLDALLGRAASRLPHVDPDIAAALAEALPGLIDAGDLVVLIDGFDEISDAREQSELRLEIERFANEWCAQKPSNRLLATSRSWTQPLPTGGPIVAVRLEPFRSRERTELISSWSRCLGLGVDRLSTLVQEAAERSNTDLANPWSLSLLCWLVGLGRKDSLRRRVELCKAAVEALFQEWRRRAEKDGGGLPLQERALEGLLSEAASEALSHSGTVGGRWLWSLAQRRAPQADASQVSRALIEQSGFLTGLGHEAVRFRDRAFQDYFAAGLLVSEVEAADARLLERALEAHWREPLRLALGRASMELSEERLRQSLETLLSQDTQPIPRAALWLAAALPDMVTVPASILEAIVERLLAAAAGFADKGIPAAVRGRIEEALVQLLATDRAPALRSLLTRILASSRPGTGSLALAVAQVLRRAGPLGDELAEILPRALHHDEGSPDRPVDAALRDLAVRAPQRLPVGSGSLRQALQRDSKLLDRLRADPAWLRLTLALYGGFVPGGPFELERIHRDSPLTRQILTALAAGGSPTSLVPELWQVWRSSPDRETAAEAFLALAALREPVGVELAVDDPRTVAARERLQHLIRILRPLASAAFGPCLDGLREISRTCSPELWSDLLSSLLRVSLESGGTPARIFPLLSRVPKASRPAFLAELWHAQLAAPYPVYGFAVLLDVAGEPLASSPWDLAKALAKSAGSVQADDSRRRGWVLPVRAQHAGTPQEILAAALDALAGFPAAFDFVSGWTLARLAPLLEVHALGTEGLVLAAGKLSNCFGARGEAVDAFLQVAPAVRERIEPDNPDPGPTLFHMAFSIRDASLRARCLRQLFRWFPELRREELDASVGYAPSAFQEDPSPGVATSLLFRQDAVLTRPDGTGTPLLLMALLGDLVQAAPSDSPGLAPEVELNWIGQRRLDALAGGQPLDQVLSSYLSSLEDNEDLPRLRAFLALGGDRSEAQRAASVLRMGASALEALARSRVHNHRLHPPVAQAVDWALERVRHDDRRALVDWADRLAQGGPGAEEAEVLLGRIHDLHPRAWPALRNLLQDSPVPVQMALLRSLCFLAARSRLSPEHWHEVSEAVAGWGPDAADAEPFVIDLPIALVEAADRGCREAPGGDAARAVAAAEAALGPSIHRLAEVLPGSPEILRERLAEIGAIRVAPAGYARTVAMAVNRIERNPEVLGVLLAWLANRLQKDDLQDSDFFCPMMSDLLGVTAAAAKRMPEAFRQHAAAFPQLGRGLRECVELHDTFTGRCAALDLIAIQGRVTLDATAALRTALRDVPELQDCALQALSRFQQADPMVLDELLHDPSSALTVHAAANLTAHLARGGALQQQECKRLAQWAWDALEDVHDRDVWTLRVGRRTVQPVLLGRLQDSLSHLLLNLVGIARPGRSLEEGS
jgi:hypothetical protein